MYTLYWSAQPLYCKAGVFRGPGYRSDYRRKGNPPPSTAIHIIYSARTWYSSSFIPLKLTTPMLVFAGGIGPRGEQEPRKVGPTVRITVIAASTARWLSAGAKTITRIVTRPQARIKTALQARYLPLTHIVHSIFLGSGAGMDS